jgi:aspartyl-tRNA(Asn)/glutamyl-tRNA(Gln) amidotransferase subunit A
MHEFAYGGTTHISHFGPTHNPWDLEHIAGGSSGGSGAAVAAGLCFGALGSDTGGSIRQPAAFCGIVGLKPTWGLVSLRGVVPLSWSLDHVGPMTRTVADAAAMLQVIAGHDPADPGSAKNSIPDYSGDLDAGVAQVRVGVPREGFYADLDPDVQSGIETALSILDGMTASRIDVALPIPSMQALREISGPVIQAEAHAYHLDNLATRPERFDPDTLARLKRGADISAASYIRARRELDRVRYEVQSMFELVDVLITPTTPNPAPTFSSVEVASDIGLSTLRNTSPFDAYGLPTISVPVALSSSGLPIGMQISGPAFAEQRVLQVANAFERASGWAGQRPSRVG